MGIYQLGERVPQIDPSAYVFDTATLIGTVILGARVSIWPYATLRGDNEPIEIGDDSNVQECSVLHADPGFPLTIGRRVTVGHQVMLHGCTIGDGSLIGIQAIVLNGAVIGRNCLIGAGCADYRRQTDSGRFSGDRIAGEGCAAARTLAYRAHEPRYRQLRPPRCCLSPRIKRID